MNDCDFVSVRARIRFRSKRYESCGKIATDAVNSADTAAHTFIIIIIRNAQARALARSSECKSNGFALAVAVTVADQPEEIRFTMQ